MLPAPQVDGSALDVLAPFEDSIAASEVDVGRREIVQAFVVAAVIVVLDEVGDGALEIAGQEVVFEQDAAFQREVPALDLTLGHRVIGLAAGVPHSLAFEPVGQIVGDVGRAVIGEQPWTAIDLGLIEP